MSFNTRKIRSEIGEIRFHMESKGVSREESSKVDKWSPKERMAYLLAIDPTPVVVEDYENIIVLDLRRKAS